MAALEYIGLTARRHGLCSVGARASFSGVIPRLSPVTVSSVYIIHFLVSAVVTFASDHQQLTHSTDTRRLQP